MVFLGRAAKSEIIPRQSRDKPPAPPCFCLPASPVRQDGVNGKIMPGAGARGSVQAKGTPLNALGPRATSGARPTGISRRDSLPASSAAAVVQVMQPVKCVLRKRDVADAGPSHAAPTCGGRLLSTLRRTVFSKGKISRYFVGAGLDPAEWNGFRFSSRGGERTDRKTFSQSTGARDLPSGGRADGHKQAGFTPAVKRSRRRASDAARTACPAQTGRCVT